MNDLLDLAIKAHGGLDRWNEIKKIGSHIAAGGAMWHVKGWPDAFANIHVSADPHRQHVEYSPFLKAGQRSVYEPNKTCIVTDCGEVLEHRDAPRTAFAGHSLGTPWDAQHLIYFTGYAMWTYLTTPFLFQMPGFKSEEIEPWDEEGESWRRLKVTFPEGTHSHSTEQVFYFDQSGLLRRQDYSADIMGGTSSANYATDHQSIGGVIFPMKRRVYSRDLNNRPIRDRVAVAIDYLSIEVD